MCNVNVVSSICFLSYNFYSGLGWLKFGGSNSSGTSIMKEIRLKNLILMSRLSIEHSRSSEPTRIDPPFPINVP